jgi:hypothetical protein
MHPLCVMQGTGVQLIVFEESIDFVDTNHPQRTWADNSASVRRPISS